MAPLLLEPAESLDVQSEAFSASAHVPFKSPLQMGDLALSDDKHVPEQPGVVKS